MIELVEASHDQAKRAQEILAPIMSYGVDQKGLYHAWQEGWLRCDTVCVDNVSTFIVFHHKAMDPTLIVNGLACLLDGEDRWDLLMNGLDALAEKHGCKSIVFHSARGGVMKKALVSGYQAECVAYRKWLPNA